MRLEYGLRLARESGRPDAQADRSLLHLRHVYKSPVDIRHYRNEAGEEGLLVGPRGETRLGRGTVSLQAIHFASMLGRSEIHIIGADLHFRGPVQHFYGDNEYGTHEVDGKRYHALDVETRMNPVEVVRHPRTGELVETTLHFKESADYIDDVVATLLPRGRRPPRRLLRRPPHRAGPRRLRDVDGARRDRGAGSVRHRRPSPPRIGAGRGRLAAGATDVDRDLILEWANDPVTRAAGPSTRGDRCGDARRPGSGPLADPESRMWVGEIDGEPDRAGPRPVADDGRDELGISVAPEARGRRLADPLLRAGMVGAERELGATLFVALIRPENDVSLRLFRGAGFADDGVGVRAGVDCVVLVRAAELAAVRA